MIAKRHRNQMRVDVPPEAVGELDRLVSEHARLTNGAVLTRQQAIACALRSWALRNIAARGVPAERAA